MSAAVISSLVRCGERDRKHEKDGQNTAGAEQSLWGTECESAFPHSGESEGERVCAQRISKSVRDTQKAVVHYMSGVKRADDGSGNSDDS